MTDLVPQNVIVEYRENSLVFTEKPTWEQAESTVNTLLKIHTTAGLWIGDVVLYLEKAYPDTYLQLFPDGELGQTIMNKRSICRKIPPERRLSACPGIIGIAAGFNNEEDQDLIINMGVEKKTVAETRIISREMHGRAPKLAKEHSVACPECNHVFIYEELST
jgi:hypothetical protein